MCLRVYRLHREVEKKNIMFTSLLVVQAGILDVRKPLPQQITICRFKTNLSEGVGTGESNLGFTTSVVVPLGE